MLHSHLPQALGRARKLHIKLLRNISLWEMAMQLHKARTFAFLSYQNFCSASIMQLSSGVYNCNGYHSFSFWEQGTRWEEIKWSVIGGYGNSTDPHTHPCSLNRAFVFVCRGCSITVSVGVLPRSWSDCADLDPRRSHVCTYLQTSNTSQLASMH